MSRSPTSALYDKRFNKFERIRKVKLWKLLCRDFLQQFVFKKDDVIDLGAGSCEFINSIKCRKKIAVDLSEETVASAEKNVMVVRDSTENLLKVIGKNKADVIFMSNLLEHLSSKKEAFKLLTDCRQVLRKNGRLLIMQPDISRVGNSYWDFFDHQIPITEKSLIEALKAVGFKIICLKSPFLPYSTKTVLIPLWPFALKIYLRFRPLQVLFGKQFFVCAQK